MESSKNFPLSRLRFSLTALSVAWVGIIVLVAHMLMAGEIARHERGFIEDTLWLADELKNRLDTNDAVLAGFSGFLHAVERNDTESAARYAASTLSAYPHIYMLEVARRVPLAEAAGFEASMRREWRHDFTLRDFPSLNQRLVGAQRGQTDTWPILFMYPVLPEADAIYGVRLETVTHLSHALALAQGNTKPVASPVFEMFEGGTAYILLQEVSRRSNDASSVFGNTMTALLLVRTGSLLANSPHHPLPDTLGFKAHMLASGNIDSPLFAREGQPGSTLDQLLLPRFSNQLSIRSVSQPTVLELSQQLRWQDLLTKEFVAIFMLLAGALFAIPAVTLRHLRAIRVNEQELKRSAYLATHDILTGLPNRYLFSDRFEQACQQHARNARGFALLLVDLDHFKEINDQDGHEIGDEVLVESARRMISGTRGCDTVARHGGDEFVLLLADLVDADSAISVADKLRQSLSADIRTSVGIRRVSCSIGIAMFPDHGTNLNAMRRSADQAMYWAKNAGRDQTFLAQTEES